MNIATTPYSIFYDCQCTIQKDKALNYEKYYQNFELERYTYFNDKNGVEIFESDIVKYKGENYIVSYKNATWYILNPNIEEELRVDCGVRLQSIADRIKYFNGINTDKLLDIEKIGNIHQHKNLFVSNDSIEQSNTNKIKRMR